MPIVNTGWFVILALLLRNSGALSSTMGESSVLDLVQKILVSSPGSGLFWDALGKFGSLPRLSDKLVGSLNSLKVRVKYGYW